MKKPLIIGIAGGSGSGKTTIANKLAERFPSVNISIINQDSYYKKNKEESLDERRRKNYDHPSAFDNDLLFAHLKELSMGNSINVPVYDFTTYNRSDEFRQVEAKDVIILEGLMLFYDERIRNLLDIKVYVETDSDVRVIRRILRDIKERGRSLESIILQYMSVVRPAHISFVEPTKRFADIIIPEGGENKVAIDLIASKIEACMREL